MRKKLAPGSSVVLFAISQLILLPLLFIAYFINQWVFAGFVTGILLVPLVIMINSITEAFGITKNHFE
jgi:fatty-acid desaturase